ncbi:MAG: hypothetical protein H7Y15_13310, partial [Pseudonocardia sp.]|nr:hypothetical protein [Pseudonocardia sp.]
APPATSDTAPTGTLDPTTPPGTTQPAPACAPVVLTPAVTVLPDGQGLLLRLPLDELPPDCTIADATLRADPEARDAADTAQIELIVEEWSADTTEVPETAGDPIVAEDDETGPFWPLAPIVADLIGNPRGGLLLSDPDEGESLAWPGGEFRLELVLGS